MPRFGIPHEVECLLRQKFTLCAYCRRELHEYPGVIGCPGDKATIEHLNQNGPFTWPALVEEDLVICCGSCNSSRGGQNLTDWFASPYCVQRRISGSLGDQANDSIVR
jgi:hypothetical protein